MSAAPRRCPAIPSTSLASFSRAYSSSSELTFLKKRHQKNFASKGHKHERVQKWIITLSWRYSLSDDEFCVVHNVNSTGWTLLVSVVDCCFCFPKTRDRGLSELVTVETVHLQNKFCKWDKMSNIWVCQRDQICRRKASIKDVRPITVGQTFLLILLIGSVQLQRKLVLQPNSRMERVQSVSLIMNGSPTLIMILSLWTESVTFENLFLSTSVRLWFSKMKKCFCTQMWSVLFQNAPHRCLSLLSVATEQNLSKKKTAVSANLT